MKKILKEYNVYFVFILISVFIYVKDFVLPTNINRLKTEIEQLKNENELLERENNGLQRMKEDVIQAYVVKLIEIGYYFDDTY